MPNVGFSRPYVAEYTTVGNNIIYKNGMRLGRGTSVSTEIEASDGNDFYADNVLGESLRGVFKSGKVSLTIAELQMNEAKFINGLKESSVTIQGKNIKEMINNEADQSPSLGIGYIKKKIVLGKTLWVGVVLTKTSLGIPSEEIETQEDEVDWQTQDLEGSIAKDIRGDWRRFSEDLDTEEKADSYVRYCLGMGDLALDELTVISVAGADSGRTEIAATPVLAAGNSYVYLVGSSLEVPYAGAICAIENGYTAWNGTDDIEAQSGLDILIVEVNAGDEAKKAGIATIVSA